MNYKVWTIVSIGILVVALGAVYYARQTQTPTNQPTHIQSTNETSGGPDPLSSALSSIDQNRPETDKTEPVSNTAAPQPPASPPPNFNKIDVDASQLPGFMPKNVPKEIQGETVVENFVVLVSDNRYQATRTFQTTRNQADLKKLYTDWFSSDNWKLQNSLDQTNLWALFATQGDESMDVQWNKNSISGVEQISIDFGYSPTPKP